MPDRYFIAAPITGKQLTLTGSEAHHLAHVMRAEVGQSVTLFDGSGYEFTAQIKTVGKQEMQLAVLDRREVNREATVEVTLAVALPKGQRQQRLVEKAVELGIAVLIPLETKRGVAQPTAAALERLRRTVVEASKQCGRNRLMKIAPAQAWDIFVGTKSDENLHLIAHPGGMSLEKVHTQQKAKQPAQSIVFAIGPEGGFTDEEISAALAAGWLTVDLGPRILRVETAAIVLAAWAIYSR